MVVPVVVVVLDFEMTPTVITMTCRHLVWHDDVSWTTMGAKFPAWVPQVEVVDDGLSCRGGRGPTVVLGSFGIAGTARVLGRNVDHRDPDDTDCSTVDGHASYPCQHQYHSRLLVLVVAPCNSSSSDAFVFGIVGIAIASTGVMMTMHPRSRTRTTVATPFERSVP